MKTNAQVALECASRFAADRTSLNSSDTVVMADKFLNWLEENTLDR